MTESELLFTQVLNLSRTELYLNRKQRLNKEEAAFIAGALKKRISGYPLQYILGKTEFMGMDFYVDKNVLIPRPETEILVGTAIGYLAADDMRHAAAILEIGTGSGCIAVSLAKYFKNTRISATDISQAALKVAGKNACLNAVAEKIVFIKSDLFKDKQIKKDYYDMIISNPPYIASADLAGLAPEINYEPKAALEAGKDGLDFYRRLIPESAKYLKKGGLLLLEIGFGQKKDIVNIIKQRKDFRIIEIIKDYNNIDRVVIVKKC